MFPVPVECKYMPLGMGGSTTNFTGTLEFEERRILLFPQKIAATLEKIFPALNMLQNRADWPLA